MSDFMVSINSYSFFRIHYKKEATCACESRFINPYGLQAYIIFRTIFNTASSAAPQIPLCRRMPGSNPHISELIFQIHISKPIASKHWLSLYYRLCKLKSHKHEISFGFKFGFSLSPWLCPTYHVARTRTPPSENLYISGSRGRTRLENNKTPYKIIETKIVIETQCTLF